MSIPAQATTAAQAAEPLDPQVVETIETAVRSTVGEAVNTAVGEAVTTAVAEALAEATTEANNAAIAEPAAAGAAESSSNLVPLILGLFGTQAVVLATLVGTIFAAVRWLDSRRAEDRQATDVRFTEVMSWIRWLVAIHVGKPVGDLGAPPDEADLPDLADLRREPSAPQAA